MEALKGSLGERAGAALAAGCDVALHCNGKLEEMEQVAAAVGALSPEAQRRIAAARACLGRPQAVDVAALQRRLRSEEHTSELQSLMRPSYAVFCLNNKNYSTSKNRPILPETTTY